MSKNEKEREGYSKTVICSAGKTAWTQAIEFENTHAQACLKNVAVWFSPGCLGKVSIRFLHKGFQIAPFSHSQFGDATGFTGDDIRYPCYVNKKLEKGDIIRVEYKNTDSSDHTVVCGMELEKEIVEPEFDELGDTEIEVTAVKKPEDMATKVKKLIMSPDLTKDIEIMGDTDE